MIRTLNGKTPRIAKSAYIDETACIIGDVEIGENSNVFPGAVIRGDMGSIRIGSQVIVEDNLSKLCLAAIRLLADRGKAETVGESARSYAKNNCDWAKSAMVLSEIYAKIGKAD